MVTVPCLILTARRWAFPPMNVSRMPIRKGRSRDNTLSVIWLSITGRSRKYSHPPTQEAPSPQGHPAVHVGPSDDGGPEPYRGTGEYLYKSHLAITALAVLCIGVRQGWR